MFNINFVVFSFILIQGERAFVGRSSGRNFFDSIFKQSCRFFHCQQNRWRENDASESGPQSGLGVNKNKKSEKEREKNVCSFVLTIELFRFVVGTTSHATLDDLVEQCSQEMRLITSCPGAKYRERKKKKKKKRNKIFFF
jgi:hypothetical protein